MPKIRTLPFVTACKALKEVDKNDVRSSQRFNMSFHEAMLTPLSSPEYVDVEGNIKMVMK